MAFLVVIPGVILALWLALRCGHGPSEYEADVWDADPEVRAARLAAKKAGRAYLSPRELSEAAAAREALGQGAWSAGDFKIANPNAVPAKRLVRRHPMRPGTWE